MERAVKDGLTRAIGVSNFDVEYLKQIVKGATIMPAVNQCCFCVGNQDNATIAFGNTLGITYQVLVGRKSARGHCGGLLRPPLEGAWERGKGDDAIHR